MGLAFRYYMHNENCGCKVCYEIREQNKIIEKQALAKTTPCSFCGKKTVTYNPYYDSYKCISCENCFDNFFDDTVRYRYKDINARDKKDRTISKLKQIFKSISP